MSKLRTLYLKPVLYGIGTLGSFQLMTSYMIPEWIRRYSTCYKDAMQCLRQHPEAIKLLGEPIKEGRINLSNHAENNADDDMNWYTVPVEGPKSSGKMRYWIDNEVSRRKLRVFRIELECNNLPDKILVIKHMDNTSKLLVRIALFGAFGVSGFGIITEYLIQNNVRNSLCYKEALKYLLDHPEAQRQLGQPIVDGRVNLGDSLGNGSEGNIFWYTVPVKGPKSHGKMTYYVTEVNESDRKYRVTKVELKLGNIKDKKLLIKKEESK